MLFLRIGRYPFPSLILISNTFELLRANYSHPNTNISFDPSWLDRSQFSIFQIFGEWKISTLDVLLLLSAALCSLRSPEFYCNSLSPAAMPSFKKVETFKYNISQWSPRLYDSNIHVFSRDLFLEIYFGVLTSQFKWITHSFAKEIVQNLLNCIQHLTSFFAVLEN